MTLTPRYLFALMLLAIMPISAQAIGVSLPAYEKVTLANGTQLLLMEKHDVPLVSMNIRIRGGALLDAPGKQGTSALLAELMQKGAGSRDSQAFAEALDNSGGTLQIGSDMETLQLSSEFMSSDARLMIELSADALQRPLLSAESFAKVKERAIQTIIGNKDSDPRALLGIYGQSWLFRDHAYGQPVNGDESSQAQINLADIQAQHKKLGGDRTLIAVVGDFKTAEMKKLLSAAFGEWRAAEGTLPIISAKQQEQGRRVLLVDKPDATQSYFWLGNVGVNRLDSELAAQNVVNTVFGGRFTSMLNTELRIKSGLSYGASSRLSRYQQPGAAYISSFTKTESTEKAIDLAIVTLDQLHQNGISPETRTSAVNYVLGQYPPNLETGPDLAEKLTELALYGLDRSDVDSYGNRINTVSPAQLDAAIKIYPTRENLAIVIIGDASKLRDVAKKYGPVTEIKITDPRYIP